VDIPIDNYILTNKRERRGHREREDRKGGRGCQYNQSSI